MARGRLHPPSDGRAEHRRYVTVNFVRFLDEWDERRETVFMVHRMPEVSKDELLERLNLVLQVHQIRDGFVAAGDEVEFPGGKIYRGRNLRLDRRFPLD